MQEQKISITYLVSGFQGENSQGTEHQCEW